jgi:hypothetical protein
MKTFVFFFLVPFIIVFILLGLTSATILVQVVGVRGSLMNLFLGHVFCHHHEDDVVVILLDHYFGCRETVVQQQVWRHDRGWEHDAEFNVQISTGHHSFSWDSEVGPRSQDCGARRLDPQGPMTQMGHFLGHESSQRFPEVDSHFHEQVQTMAGEDRVRFDFQDDEDGSILCVTEWESQGCPGLHVGTQRYVERGTDVDDLFPVTVCTDLGRREEDHTLSLTIIAFDKHLLHHPRTNRTGRFGHSSAGTTAAGRAIPNATETVAGWTGDTARQLDDFGGRRVDILQTDFELETTGRRRRWWAREIGICSETLVSEAVVGRTFLNIRQDFVGVVDFFETVRVSPLVRVVHARQAVVGLFDLRNGCLGWEFQIVVQSHIGSRGMKLGAPVREQGFKHRTRPSWAYFILIISNVSFFYITLRMLCPLW